MAASATISGGSTRDLEARGRCWSTARWSESPGCGSRKPLETLSAKLEQDRSEVDRRRTNVPVPKSIGWGCPVALTLALLKAPGTSLAAAHSSNMGLNTEQRQALELLANYRHGASEELFVFVHQFKRDTIAGLVRSGLITAKRSMKAGGEMMVRIRITEAGRDALTAEG
jgi:hypothetical protein